MQMSRRAVRARAYYSACPERWVAYRRRQRRRAAEFLKTLKNKPCMDCGGVFHPCQMDFDHRPGERKLKPVARIRSFKAIQTEVAKCDLVCANCHRLRTWNREERYGK